MVIRIPRNQGYVFVFLFATLLCSINIMGFHNQVYSHRSFSSVFLCVRKDDRYYEPLEPVVSFTVLPTIGNGRQDEGEFDDDNNNSVSSSSSDTVINVNGTIPDLSENGSGSANAFLPTSAIPVYDNATATSRPEDPSDTADVSGVDGSRESEVIIPSSVVPSTIPSVSPSVFPVLPFSPSAAIPTTMAPTTVAPTTAIPTTVIPTTSTPTTATPTTTIPTSSPPSSPRTPHTPRNKTKPRPRQTPATPPPFVPCARIQFYNWRDGKGLSLPPLPRRLRGALQGRPEGTAELHLLLHPAERHERRTRPQVHLRAAQSRLRAAPPPPVPKCVFSPPHTQSSSPKPSGTAHAPSCNPSATTRSTAVPRS